jgi:predicted Zn-dependent protease
MKWAAGGALVVASLTALWFYLPETVARIMPRSWESALGEQAVEQVAVYFGGGRAEWCESNEASAAIAALTQRLATAAGSDVGFQIRVLNSPTLNAFAVPGDRIVLIKGLIDFAKHPDEIAGVLAHEMAHVIRRHPTQNMVRAMGLQMIAGTILGGDTSGDLLVAAGETLVLLKYGRDAEQEADDIAREILAKAGVGIGGLNSFFRRLEARNSASTGPNAFLSTHPPLHDRITSQPSGTTAARPAMTSGQWQAVQAMCR